ncbi:MAG: potassium-transporting ATPase subunit KdpC [Bdellovibrionales bacterium]
MFFAQLRAALVLIALLTLLTGIAYPLGITLIAQVLFPHQAKGSLIERGGRVMGSERIGQSFTDEKYFFGRPSRTMDAGGSIDPYNAASSGGSNLGPTSRAFVDGIKQRADALRVERSRMVPVDLVTTSASGLDPHITPAAAQFQISRVARARNLPETDVAALVAKHTHDRMLGFFGEPRVNVLELNLALDDLAAKGAPPSP